MTLLQLVRTFMDHDATTAEITAVDIPSDPERKAWIEQKAAAAKEKLGERYLCHERNRVQRRAA